MSLKSVKIAVLFIFSVIAAFILGAKMMYDMLMSQLDKSVAERRKPRSVVSYADFSTHLRGRNRYGRYDRVNHKLTDIIFNNRAEAEEVLSNLSAQIENHKVVTVADLYDLVGIEGEFAGNKWGWHNLDSARVIRQPHGYFLVLPKPVELK